MWLSARHRCSLASVTVFNYEITFLSIQRWFMYISSANVNFSTIYDVECNPHQLVVDSIFSSSILLFFFFQSSRSNVKKEDVLTSKRKLSLFIELMNWNQMIWCFQGLKLVLLLFGKLLMSCRCWFLIHSRSKQHSIEIKSFASDENKKLKP